METMPADDMDLRAERLSCPHCGEDLLRVDHSPLYEDHLLYCDRCANRVEFSIHDPAYVDIVREAIGSQTRQDAPGHASAVEVHALMHAVEARLKPCSCGGHFRHDAPRRCHACQGEVIAGEPAVDLWPGFCDLDDDADEPPAEQIQRIEAFEQRHIRRGDIWRD